MMTTRKNTSNNDCNPHINGKVSHALIVCKTQTQNVFHNQAISCMFRTIHSVYTFDNLAYASTRFALRSPTV